jgi:RNA polymerase sigma-32 factor
MSVGNRYNELETYMASASRYPILTREEEVDLARRWRDERDEHAAERLVLCNLRAVIKIAGEFRNRHIAFEDLVQEGNVGLLRAIDRYDPERGTRFLSYAGWWIRACIKEYLLRSRSLVRIGTTQKQRAIYSRLGRAKRELETKYPDIDPVDRIPKLAEILDASPGLVADMEARLSGHDLSLNAQVSDDSETSYVDMLWDMNPDTEELSSSRDLYEFRTQCLGDAMGCLSDKERFIIEQRYLVLSPRTLRELGEELGISRERVRQLEVRAKGKLRKLLSSRPWIGELIDFMDDVEPRVA